MGAESWGRLHRPFRGTAGRALVDCTPAHGRGALLVSRIVPSRTPRPGRARSRRAPTSPSTLSPIGSRWWRPIATARRPDAGRRPGGYRTCFTAVEIAGEQGSARPGQPLSHGPTANPRVEGLLRVPPGGPPLARPSSQPVPAEAARADGRGRPIHRAPRRLPPGSPRQAWIRAPSPRLWAAGGQAA